ncbi:(2Fe-2S)-binding protein [Bradyrhizobium sp. KBS0727]|uniref:(2Fe-2S)-binding protein n=1 Tax=unclassified Bradyrhizobium TaxID=2631580 RepID=UPI00110D6FC8|nr:MULTISPECIES: (2Fe-2S)-binding protein [unclassified Bradyrhizobium]QDW40514.1 (2Fe-2S)-binding protein [Bradyrhizobium sp. KBS0725]QDW47119.1 (2Fe-2S)-binding protein [Bradyrhizobium sp. KBS0727]
MNQHAKSISFVLNGSKAEMLVQTHENLVELLNRLDLHGARESCGQGLCGCCTVIVDDIAVSGCLCPAAFIDGKSVETIENLDRDGRLSLVQQAYIDEGAFQCGFCTSGFILMTHKLLEENPMPTDEEIRNYLAGNLCRCAAYPEIISAVKSAARKMARS